jgi:undecaprenyl-diphosphatase
LLSDVIERNTDQIWLIGVMMIVGALLLALADGTRGKRTIDEVSLSDALIMGAAQALALQPGVSRSGVTITAGRFVGLSRDGAARFAFLMSLPVTAGALLFKWVDVQGEGGIPAGFGPPFVWGIVASGITGYIAVWGTLKIIRTHSFLPFVLYRLILGVLILTLVASTFR